MKTKTFKSVTLNNGQVVRAGDIVQERKPITRLGLPYAFQVKGIFICTTGGKCFYKQNPHTGVYYGNSGQVNEYKKIDKRKYFKR